MSSLSYWVLGSKRVHRTEGTQAGAASEPVHTSVHARIQVPQTPKSVRSLWVRLSCSLSSSCGEVPDTGHLWREGLISGSQFKDEENS